MPQEGCRSSATTTTTAATDTTVPSPGSRGAPAAAACPAAADRPGPADPAPRPPPASAPRTARCPGPGTSAAPAQGGRRVRRGGARSRLDRPAQPPHARCRSCRQAGVRAWMSNIWYSGSRSLARMNTAPGCASYSNCRTSAVNSRLTLQRRRGSSSSARACVGWAPDSWLSGRLRSRGAVRVGDRVVGGRPRAHQLAKRCLPSALLSAFHMSRLQWPCTIMPCSRSW